MSSQATTLIPAARIERRILLLRNEKVMLDSDLAELYGVETKALNQAVQRNLDRFPTDFMFQLSNDEMEFAMRSQAVTSNAKSAERTNDFKGSLRSQIVTSNPGRGGRRYRPYAFTEQGIAMLSSVLASPRAIQVNIGIMRAFVQLRQMLASHADLARKLAALESKYDKQFRVVFDAMRALMSEKTKPKREIGFHTLMAKPSKGGGTSAKRFKP
ncbi:MAG: ORF6N domain-containing protein [Verrucomicrobiota bacterium]